VREGALLGRTLGEPVPEPLEVAELLGRDRPRDGVAPPFITGRRTNGKFGFENKP
jgi:hypothetical protein